LNRILLLRPDASGLSFCVEGPLNPTITAVTGLEAGHYTDREHATGCTVVLCRQGAVGGVDVRGGSPGTRETDLLRPMHRVDRVHAIVLSGGSAFGLDAASGVTAYLEEQGVGFPAGPAIVPIVAAAILFDLGLVTTKVRPGPREGRFACLAANSAPLAEGSVGAGTGATVGKALGMGRAVKGGIGSASLTLPGGAVLAALVAVNSYGGVVDYHTGQVIAGPRREDGAGFHDTQKLLLQDTPLSPPLVRGEMGKALTNTTIGIVATDALLTREEANFLAQVSHDGLALAIRPCHTIRDGDTMFALSTGHHQGRVDLTTLGAAAVEATAQAVLRAVYAAEGLGGVAAVRELLNE
jgi:L-aminopeptidase/D-esterase-like protein